MTCTYSILSDVETPISLFHKISGAESVCCLLESTEGDTRLARYSFIGVSPLKTVSFKAGRATIRDCQSGIETVQQMTNPLTVLQEEMPKGLVPPETEIPFTGGWVGYMGYGATRYFDDIPQQSEDPCNVPEGYYGFYDTVIAFDHLYRRISLVSQRPETETSEIWNSLLKRITTVTPLKPVPYWERSAVDALDVFASVTQPASSELDFCRGVKQCKAWIEEGQVFQIVLSHRFSRPIACEPIQVYRVTQSLNPSPYAYYLQFPGFVYLGSSPETFIRCQDGQVMLRALAGTRPRGETTEEDAELAAALRANEKELAEHRMLVDLGRNDLGKVCDVGSVVVGEIATITRYRHVMHLSTEVTGRLRSDKTAFDVFQGCFPRGTVTGAPKIRAMELLSTIEPEQRGVYSGVVGYFDQAGNMDGAIAIRSALIKDGMIHVNAGAGIVYDSDPRAEYEETRNKAKSMLTAVHLAELDPVGVLVS